jgi:hypothetical protein
LAGKLKKLQEVDSGKGTGTRVAVLRDISLIMP